MKTAGRGSTIARSAEGVCWSIAVLALAWYGLTWFERWEYQTQAARALAVEIGPRLPDPEPLARSRGGTPPARSAATANPAGLAGRLEVPRLGLSAMVRPGTDSHTLRVAIGHIEGTGLPSAPAGNVGLAAHRDTFFRPLRSVRLNDEIRLTTPKGTYAYRVIDTHIVDPTDVWVLDEAGRPRLTLVTCYPFDFIGRAPQRFIVHAERETDRRSGLGAGR